MSMKENAHEILKSSLASHREPMLSSRQTCLGILKDYGGREHPEVNLLAEALDEQIPDRLLRNQPVTEEILESLANQFSTKRFYTADISTFVVRSWADALGLITLEPSLFAIDRSVVNGEQMRETDEQLQERSWYFTSESSTIGPISQSLLNSLVAANELNENALVWSEGMQSWEPISVYFAMPISVKSKVDYQNILTDPNITAIAAPNSSSQPILQSSPKAIKQFGGISRTKYFGIIFGLLVVNVIALGVVSEASKNITTLFFNLCYIIPAFLRLKNTGMNPWWSLISFIPLVNLYIGFRCLVCQQGYSETKKLDAAGKGIAWTIVGIFFVTIVIAILTSLSN